MFDKNIELKGKHASYVKYLDAKDNNGAFNRYIDLYMIGAIWGSIHNKKSQIDNSGNETAKILTETLIGERNKLEFIYRLIMLIDDSEYLTNEERLDRAFRDDTDPEALEKNLETFHSYALGGIESLYEEFRVCTTRDDLIDKVYQIVERFYNENYEGHDDFDEVIKQIIY